MSSVISSRTAAPIAGICAGCMSWFSSIMGAYERDPVFAQQKTSNALFLELFLISVFCVVFLAVLALVGLFGIIG